MSVTASERLKVFVSYSRRDSSEFAQELVSGLEVAGFAPFLDQHDIAKAEEWEERLGDLILKSDTVVFVMSPEAIRSERCAWEVDRTIELSKRLVPVVWKPVLEQEVPERLRRLNYIFFSEGKSFARPLGELSTALRQDLTWIREHTRLGEMAARWEGRGRPHDQLLRGTALSEAQAWVVARRDPRAPEITDLQRAYINASANAEAEQQAEQQRQLAERERLVGEAEVAARQRESALVEREAALQQLRENERSQQQDDFERLVLGSDRIAKPTLQTWDLSAQARDIIGGQYGFGLRPRTMASRLRAKGPKTGPLVRILERPLVQKLIQDYEKYNRQALQEQRRSQYLEKIGYSTPAGLLLIATLLLLVMPVLPPLPLGLPAITIFLHIIQTIALFTIICAHYLTPIDKNMHWQQARARAEDARLRFFDTVMKTPEQEHTGELPVLMLKLEWYLCYQINFNQDHYGMRGLNLDARLRRKWQQRLILLLCLLCLTLLVLLSPYHSIFSSLEDHLWNVLTRGDEMRRLVWVDLLNVGMLILVPVVSKYGEESAFQSVGALKMSSENIQVLREVVLESVRKAAAMQQVDYVLTFVRLYSRQFSPWNVLIPLRGLADKLREEHQSGEADRREDAKLSLG